jgi:tRNA (guanine26-N2/guanine27-N2)-dimethyltransferase
MAFSFPVEEIVEGAARIVIPKLEAFKRAAYDYAPSRAPVFYNPIMELNRDIAVLVLQAFQATAGRELIVSEPLAGCGVRGIRFAKEVEAVHKVHLNDINPEAFKMAQYNIELNKMSRCVSLTNEDANLFLSQHAAPHSRFDCIDVDPFGTPAIYMDSAIRALRDGGLLALTATDLAPLCGAYPKSALRKYGGLPLRTEYCHELAVRLLSGCLATSAAKHEIGVDIVFSHSSNHYIRVYALARYGAKKANGSIQKTGYILHCFTCLHRETITSTSPIIRDQCSECSSPLKIAGPLWLGNIADKRFCELIEKDVVSRSFKHKGRIVKLLTLVKAESDAPATYYVLDKICDKLGVPVPSLKEVIRNLREKGFQALATHFHSRGVKTNAPAKVVTEAILEIAR